jgi:hypothetical protein
MTGAIRFAIFTATALSLTVKTVLSQAEPPSDSSSAALAADATIRYDRFDRDLSFALPAVSVEVRKGDAPVQLVMLVGRRLDAIMGEYAALLFEIRDTVAPSSGLITLIADDQKPKRKLSKAVQSAHGAITYPMYIFTSDLETMSGARVIEARLPDGTEVIIPIDVL